MTTRAAATAKTNRKPAAAPPKRTYKDYSDDDDDDYDSSSTDYSDNSEEFQPLAFQLYNGKTNRYSGAPYQQRIKSMKFSAKSIATEGEDDDDDFEMPMRTTTAANTVKRTCGKVQSPKSRAKMSLSLDSVLSDDDEDSSANVLPVQLTSGKKRARGVGKVTRPPIVEATESQKERSALSESEEAPLNSEVILGLVRRIRAQPIEEIPVEAFEHVNWGDENFQEELKPLREIYLEIKAHSVQKVKPKFITKTPKARSVAVKEAIQKLPEEKAMLAKIARVENRNLKVLPSNTVLKESRQKGEAGGKDPTATAKDRNLNLNLKQPEGATKNTPEVRKQRGVTSATSKVSARGGVAEMNAPMSEVKKLKSSLILPNEPSNRSKEATMGEAEKKMRKQAAKKKKSNRSLTFSEILVPEATEEIQEKEDDIPLAEGKKKEENLGKLKKPAEPTGKRSANGVGFRMGAEGTSGQSRTKKQRHKGKRGGSSVTFTELPTEQASEIVEDNTTVEVKKNERAGDVPSGAVGNTNLSSRPRSSTLTTATPTKPSAPRRRTLDDGTADNTRAKQQQQQNNTRSSSRRQKSANRRSREISMSQLNEDIVGEIVEDYNTAHIADVGKRSPQPKFPKSILSSSQTLSAQPPTANGRRKVPPAAPTVTKAPEENKRDLKLGVPKPRTRRVRPKNHHSYELSFSALPEDEAGEIKESNTDSISEPPPLPSQMKKETPSKQQSQKLPSIPNSASRSGKSLPAGKPTGTAASVPRGTFLDDTVDPSLPDRRKSEVSLVRLPLHLRNGDPFEQQVFFC